MNLPNKITTGRFILSVVMFVLLAFADSQKVSCVQYQILLDIGFVLFLIAAITDFLDGYFARKYNMISTFGRIADPFVDKILICGGFIFFIPLMPYPIEGQIFTPLVKPWMAVVIIGREMIISALRSFIESQGIAFGAQAAGKFKMVLQCIALGFVFAYTSHLYIIPYSDWFVTVLLWITVLVTIGSAYDYLRKAYQLLKTPPSSK